MKFEKLALELEDIASGFLLIVINKNSGIFFDKSFGVCMF